MVTCRLLLSTSSLYVLFILSALSTMLFVSVLLLPVCHGCMPVSVVVVLVVVIIIIMLSFSSLQVISQLLSPIYLFSASLSLCNFSACFSAYLSINLLSGYSVSLSLCLSLSLSLSRVLTSYLWIPSIFEYNFLLHISCSVPINLSLIVLTFTFASFTLKLDCSYIV